MFTRLPSCKITGAILVALVGFTLVLVNAPRANADEGNTHTTVVASYGDTFLVVSEHNVVASSTLRHCPLEDGGPHLRSQGPCTWNVGDADGNGAGLAYVMYRSGGQRVALYVWASDPTVNGWHWVTHRNSGYADCVVKAGHVRARCADGTYLR